MPFLASLTNDSEQKQSWLCLIGYEGRLTEQRKSLVVINRDFGSRWIKMCQRRVCK